MESLQNESSKYLYKEEAQREVYEYIEGWLIEKLYEFVNIYIAMTCKFC